MAPIIIRGMNRGFQSAREPLASKSRGGSGTRNEDASADGARPQGTAGRIAKLARRVHGGTTRSAMPDARWVYSATTEPVAVPSSVSVSAST